MPFVESSDIEDSKFVCIHCGTSVAALYKQQRKDLLKLLHCPQCSNIADKYIEYDPPIIFLDIVLQHTEAYRHLLYNAGYRAFWKLAIICALCDAYTLWVCYCAAPEQTNSTSIRQKWQLPQFEWDFYLMSFVVLVETSLYFAMVLSTTVATHKFLQWPRNICLYTLVNGLIIGNSGKLLAVPALIWGQSSSNVYLGLTTLFIWLSEVNVFQAVCGQSLLKSFLVITAATSVQYLVRWELFFLLKSFGNFNTSRLLSF